MYIVIRSLRQFAGKLSAQTDNELEEHINKSRDEWKRNI